MAPAGAVVLPPLLWLLLGAVSAMFRSPGMGFDAVSGQLLLRSGQFAALATGLALGLGVPYGWLLARHRLPGRPLWTYASLLPLLLPPYAAVLAWGMFLTPDGAFNRLLLRWGWIAHPILTYRALWLGAAVVGFAYWPIVAWFVLFAARSVPVELEEAARLHLDPAPAARWSARPVVGIAAGAGALLVFLLALAEFAVPNYLGLATYPVAIVNHFQDNRNIGQITRLALPLLLVVTPLVGLHLRLLARTPVGTGERAGQLRLGNAVTGGLGAAACLLVLLLTSGVPLVVLGRASLPLQTYAGVWAESADHFANTIITAGSGATLALLGALLYGWASQRRKLPALDFLLTLPYALPASLMGVAMIWLLNRPGPAGRLYDSGGGLVWMYVALFFPFALRSLEPAWGLVDASLLDEGRMAGAEGWSLFRVTAWPTLRPFALVGWGLVAVLAARESDATALLRVPEFDTIAFRIQDYLHFAPTPKVAALCILVVILSALVGLALASWAASDRSET